MKTKAPAPARVRNEYTGEKNFSRYYGDVKMTPNQRERLLVSVKSWYVVVDAEWEGNWLTANITSKHGSGYESLGAFLEGFDLGLHR